MMHAELEGIVCSGPRRGKQFTYALLGERAPNLKAVERAEAILLITRWQEFQQLPALLKGRTPLVVDGRRVLAPDAFARYDGIGR